MSKIRVAAFSVSIDGFGAGPSQSLENPLGVRGMELHRWFLATEAFHEMHGGMGGTRGTDNDFAKRSFENVGAWILGRNMFGPIRGSWGDQSWKGWWGENPPYHTPVFVLTHYPRPPLRMDGGTEFHFIADGLPSALTQARQAANGSSKGNDIRIGGGVSLIRQCLTAGFLDELHLAISPVLLGKGEPLLSGLDLPALGFNTVRSVPGEQATHLLISKP